MKKKADRILVGILVIIAGIFLIINQFTFKLPLFPWGLLFLGVAIFILSIFSGNFFGGLQALLWLGGLSFAFYYNQIFPGILIIIGISTILDAFKSYSHESTKININIDNEENQSNK